MAISGRTLTAAIACLAILIVVAAIWLRERATHKRISAGAARQVAEKLGGLVAQIGSDWRVVAKLDGRPVVLTLGGKFLAHSDIDNRQDFVPALNIEVPCTSTAELVVHGNWPTGKNYLRDMAAHMRGSKLSTGTPEFDSQFLVEGDSRTDSAIVDENIRKMLLASKTALYGRSWVLRLRGGSASFEEVFSEDVHGSYELTENQVADDALARLSLVLALAANAEQRTPSHPTSIAPSFEGGPQKP
jgi:hypothetical protein